MYMSNSNPTIIIKPDDEKPYAKLDWEPYKGKLVDVIYRKEKDIVVPQIVTSSDIMISQDKRFDNFINDFLIRTKLRMGPFHKIAEAGRWVIRGKNTYTSNIFTSYSINSIKPNDAFPPLAETVQEALRNEPEENLKGLILMHTHPIPNTPLSPRDYNSVRTLAKEIGMEKGDLIQIMAIPINEKGNLVFQYDLYM